MKITDAQVIREGEKELINAVKDEIDPKKIREVLAHKLSDGNLRARDGQIVIHNNQIAFQLDFELQFTGSILLDRDGNLLSDGEDEIEIDNDSDSSDNGIMPKENGLTPETDPVANTLVASSTEESLDADLFKDSVSDKDVALDEEDSQIENIDADFLQEDFSEDEIMEDDLDNEEFDKSVDIEEDVSLEDETLELEFEQLEEDIQDDNDIEDILLDPDSDEEDSSELTEEKDDQILSEIIQDEEDKTDSKEDLVDDDINEILEESRAFWKRDKNKN